MSSTPTFTPASGRSRAPPRGIKWNIYDAPPEDENRKKVDDHALLDLIRRPNERMGWSYFFEQHVGYLMMAGNGYVVRNRPSTSKPPTALWPLRPDRVKVKKGTAIEPIAGFTYSAGGQIIEFLPDRFGQRVLHPKLFHPTDDGYCLSPLEAACRNVDQSNEIQRWNLALMQKSGWPSGILSTDQTLSPDQFDRMKGELREKFTGSMNAGTPMLLEGGLGWERESLTPAELDWLFGDERASRKICSAFNVPPELIGIRASGGLNDSNFKDARKAFYLETVLPLLDYVSDDFNSLLTPMFAGKTLFMDYDRDDIEAIQEDRDVFLDAFHELTENRRPI
jgi:HK97 family phage portal protein